MRIETVAALADNYTYLVVCEQSGVAAAVDPAEAESVIAKVDELGVELKAIWSTHHHWDHTGGNDALARHYQGIEVYGHGSDRGRLPQLNRPLDHGDEVTLGQCRGKVLHVPGHTTGALAYLVNSTSLFSGDTLFLGGCGRIFEGTAEMLYRSLNETLGQLDGGVEVYCGHEYTDKNLAFAQTIEAENALLKERIGRVIAQRRAGEPTVPATLATERLTNPFLRCSEPAVIAGARARSKMNVGDDPVAVFAALRSLRDHF